MSGEYDPCNYTLPQQPLHKCMFPQASRYPTFKTVTNPYDCTLGDVRFVTKTFVVMIVWSFKMKFEYNPEKNSIKANLLLSKEAQC